MEEELALLEEQLAAAHADIERLQEQLAEASARDGTHESESGDLRRQVVELRRVISERDASSAAQAREAQGLREALGAAEEAARDAASRYRDVLLAAEPQLPGDLVSGRGERQGACPALPFRRPP